MSSWNKCVTCGKEIEFNGTYQKCSVSSCNKKVFCSVDCWDVHVPVMNHKSAWAVEESAPSKTEEERPRRRMVQSNTRTLNENLPRDVLIIGTKLKTYIKARSDFNTSASVFDRLSDIVRILCDDAIEKTRMDGRKTVMDRDFQ